MIAPTRSFPVLIWQPGITKPIEGVAIFSRGCHFAVHVAIAIAVLISAGPMSVHATSAHAIVIKLAHFGENLSLWTNEDESEPLLWNEGEQALDFTAPVGTLGVADWDFPPSGVQDRMADGGTNTWTISFDVRINAVQSATELNIRPQTAAGAELLNIGFEQDDGDKWRIVPTGQGGGNGATNARVTEGLFAGDWYHIDLVFNRSGAALTDYNGIQDLADDQVDLWVGGLLGVSGIDMTNDTPEKLTMRVDVDKGGRKIEAGPPAPPGTMVDEIERFIPETYNRNSTLACEVTLGTNERDFHLESRQP